jgi:hypothetical protein
LTGKVVSIADGDTLTLLVDKTQVKVRLDGIDTPERAQPFGRKARQALAKIVFGKVVQVDDLGKDRYGRTLRIVWLRKRSIQIRVQVQRFFITQSGGWIGGLAHPNGAHKFAGPGHRFQSGVSRLQRGVGRQLFSYSSSSLFATSGRIFREYMAIRPAMPAGGARGVSYCDCPS